MPYQTVPLRIIGGTSQNRSVQANNELTKNWYAEVSITGRNKAVLLPWYGTTTFGTSPGLTDRGGYKFQDVLYQVSDQVLYSIDESGNYTSIGSVSGTQRCIFSNSVVGTLEQMVICTGANVYIYDGTTLAVQDFSADSATYLNSKTIYDSGGNTFDVTGASGASDITSSGKAESNADDLRRPYAFGQFVYMFGYETIEPFYDAGTGSPPIVRMSGAIMQKGLGALYSIANTDQFLYFLADDLNVYKISQTSAIPVSTPAIVTQMSKLDTENCVAYAIVIDGQDFVVFNFGDDELSYAYSEQTGEWVNLSSGTDGGRYIGSSYVRCYGKDIMFDYSTGNAIELTPDAYDDLGNTIQRRRQLPPINSSMLGMGAGKRLLMNKANIILQTGVGIASGQGDRPQIMVEYSKDGENWTGESWPKIGQMGQTLIKVEYNKMVSFYDLYLRITISDPVFSSLHDASLKVKEYGY